MRNIVCVLVLTIPLGCSQPQAISIQRIVATPKPTKPPQRITIAWPGDDKWALRITHCETKGYTDTYNESSKADGWWQFKPHTWSVVLGQPGVPSDHTLEYQTKQAWRLFKMYGPTQWECHLLKQ